MTVYAPTGLQWGLPRVKNGMMVEAAQVQLLDLHAAYLAACLCPQTPIMLMYGTTATSIATDAFGERKIVVPVPDFTKRVVVGMRASHDLYASGGVTGASSLPVDFQRSENAGVAWCDKQSLEAKGELGDSTWATAAESAEWDYTTEMGAADDPPAGKAPLPVTKAASPGTVWVRITSTSGAGDSCDLYALHLQPLSDPSMSLEV